MNLSRGARRLLSLLQSYARLSGRAFPFQATLARKLDCDTRTIRRYVAELREAGLLNVQKRQHSSAEYFIQTGQNVRSGVRSDVRSDVRSGTARGLGGLSGGEFGISNSADDVARKPPAKEPLWESIRRYVGDLQRRGLSEEQARAGVVLGLARRAASGITDPIRTASYFAGPVQEAKALPAGYIAHVEQWLERKCG